MISISRAKAALSLGRLYSSQTTALGSSPVKPAASRLSRVPSGEGTGAHRSSTLVTGSEKYSGSRRSTSWISALTTSVLPQPGGPCTSTHQRFFNAARTRRRTGSAIVARFGTFSAPAIASRISAVRSTSLARVPSAAGSARRSRVPLSSGRPQTSGKPSAALASTCSSVRGESSRRISGGCEAQTRNTPVRSNWPNLRRSASRHAVSFAVTLMVTIRSRIAKSLRRAAVSASDSLSARNTPMQPSARRSCSPRVQLQAICISCDWIAGPACSESSIRSTNLRPGLSWRITSWRSTSSPVRGSRTGAFTSRSSGARLAAGT